MNFTESTAGYETWLAGKLEAFGGLDAAALALKHEKMRGEFAHPFLRATFYRWAERWQDLEKDAPVVLSVGDVHVENFGTWTGPEKELVWGINDADEACRLPWVSDVVRLGVSVHFALKESSVAGALPESACESVLAGYAAAMAAEEAASPAIIKEGHGLHRLIKEIILDVTPEAFWEEEDAKKRAVQHLPGRAAEVLTAATPITDSGLAFLEPIPEEPPGTGSMGKRRFYSVALVNDERVMREAKPAVPSALTWVRNTVDDGSTAALLGSTHRIKDGTQRLDRGWIVRGISRDADKLKFKQLAKKKASPEELKCLLQCMGRELAGLHRSGGDSSVRRAILVDLAKRGPGDGWYRGAVAKEVAFVEKDRAEFTLTIPPLPARPS